MNMPTAIKNAQVIYFEHSGHYPFIEEAEVFWGTVADFLNSRLQMKSRNP
jgi:pimeloyl-ACP methyl ester carboxylesterase